MKITVEFCDCCLPDLIMEGPNVDYSITEDYLVVTSDKFDGFPKKRVTLPMANIFSITEENGG